MCYLTERYCQYGISSLECIQKPLKSRTMYVCLALNKPTLNFIFIPMGSFCDIYSLKIVMLPTELWYNKICDRL